MNATPTIEKGLKVLIITGSSGRGRSKPMRIGIAANHGEALRKQLTKALRDSRNQHWKE